MDKTIKYKQVILNGIPSLITFLSILLPIINKTTFTIISIFSIIVLTITFVIFSHYFSTKEQSEKDNYLSTITDLNNQIIGLKNQNLIISDNKEIIEQKARTIGSILYGFTGMFATYSKGINNIAHDIQNKGMAETKDWDIIGICETICQRCCDTLRSFTGLDEDDINVGYIKKYKDSSNNEMVNMIAHSSSPSTRPKIYNKPEKLESCSYYYGKILRDENPEIEILLNPTEIIEAFTPSGNAGSAAKLSKYSQYITVPIVCDGNKISGLLQIVVFNDKKIKEDKAQLKKVATAYIVPFCSLILLVNKIEKGLFSKPKPTQFDVYGKEGLYGKEKAV